MLSKKRKHIIDNILIPKGRQIIVLLSILLLSLSLFGQSHNMIFQREQLMPYEKTLYQKDAAFHTSIKPWLRSEVKEWINADSIDNRRNLIGKLTGHGNYRDSASGSQLDAGLLFAAVPGLERNNSRSKTLFQSFIGAGVMGQFTEKFSYSANFITANGSYPAYINDFIVENSIVPGDGFAYGTQSGYHYRNASGYLSFSPSTVFNFQLGHGRHFIGDGYRSLLLSDAANNYSYFRLSATIWKLKYISLFAHLKDIRLKHPEAFGRQNFEDKFAAIHYLSYDVASWLNIGIFESVIWQARDSVNNRGFDANYLNPLIFYRPVEYSIGSSDRMLMGLNFKISPFQKLHFYGQIALDEFLLSEIKAREGWWGNKQAAQAGFKWFDAFSLNNLIVQAEYNYARPYIYSHVTSLSSYGHYNQPLAHPLGANFRETIGILRYQQTQWSLEGKLIYAEFGSDTAGISFGGDVFQPYTLRPSEHGHFTGQGLKTKLLFSELVFNYMIYPKFNLIFEAGARQRMTASDLENSTNRFVWLGLRTALWNTYQDF